MEEEKVVGTDESTLEYNPLEKDALLGHGWLGGPLLNYKASSIKI